MPVSGVTVKAFYVGGDIDRENARTIAGRLSGQKPIRRKNAGALR
jgi:hypothetical protein